MAARASDNLYNFIIRLIEKESSMSEIQKKMTRSTTNKMIGGVAGGMAAYFNMDPTMMRIIWVAGSILTSGAGAVLYLILMFVLPEDTAGTTSAGPGGGAGMG
jgi:phage shock protein C